MKRHFATTFILIVFLAASFAQTTNPRTTLKPVSRIGEVPVQHFPQFNHYLVIISGKVSKGSGSIIKIGTASVVVTNAHVLSGNDGLSYRLLDSSAVSTGQLGVARGGFDAAIIAQTSVKDGLELMQEVDKNVSIGDEVVVLGNSAGEAIVTEITGKVLGIGPDRIEVDAKFVAGNSGSPIIHVKSGKVIGIATIAVRDLSAGNVAEIRRDSPIPEWRRFGYRLDVVPGWYYPNWDSFQREGKILADIELHSQHILNLNRDIWDDGQITLKRHQSNDNRLKSFVTEWLAASERKDLSAASVQEVALKFLRNVIFETTVDVKDLHPAAFSEYHAKKLQKEIQLREALKKEFQSLLNVQHAAGKITLP